AAGADLRLVRLAVDAPLPRASLPLEVLHHVGDVGPRAIDARRLEGLVEELPCRTDEGVALDVLAVSGLLADEHQLCAGWALAEHRLGGPGEQVTSLAGPGRLTEGFQAAALRNPGSSALGGGLGHPTTVCTLPPSCRSSSGTVSRRTPAISAAGPSE